MLFEEELPGILLSWAVDDRGAIASFWDFFSDGCVAKDVGAFESLSLSKTVSRSSMIDYVMGGVSSDRLGHDR